MSDWRERARELLAAGMSVNNVAREIGKSEFCVRQSLNLNGAADRYRAKHRPNPASRAEPGAKSAQPLTRPISLAPVSLGREPEAEQALERKIVRRSRIRTEHPRIALIREIHQRMIRQGKIPSRDLLSEWRS